MTALPGGTVVAALNDGDGGLRVRMRLDGDNQAHARMLSAAVNPTPAYLAEVTTADGAPVWPASGGTAGAGPLDAVVVLRPRHRSRPIDSTLAAELIARLEHARAPHRPSRPAIRT